MTQVIRAPGKLRCSVRTSGTTRQTSPSAESRTMQIRWGPSAFISCSGRSLPARDFGEAVQSAAGRGGDAIQQLLVRGQRQQRPGVPIHIVLQVEHARKAGAGGLE